MWDSLLCLLPSLLLFLAAALCHWPPARCLAVRGVKRLGWALWIGACWILALPRPSGWDQDADTEPQLVCQPTALASFLIQHCGALSRPALAAWPWGDPHLQTLRSLVWPVEDGLSGERRIRFTRDQLLLGDGGIVALDWAVGPQAEHTLTKKEHPAAGRVLGCHTSNPPILLLLPNSLGQGTTHLLRLCALALRQGFYPVVFHRRGQCGCPLATSRFQEFGDPSDLVQAVAYLRSRYPSSALVAVSEGSGSGLLLSYLGECGSSSYLTAAACISPVLHGQLWFETPMPSLYRWGALFYRKLQLSRYASALSSEMDVGRILRCRSLREMEELMFCAAGQLGRTKVDPLDRTGEERARPKQDWAGYWERNEPLRDADEVAVPVLCLRSCDDPLLPPPSTLPMSLFQNSPYFLLALTSHGGHCGFTLEEEDSGGAVSWSHVVVLEYFRVVADFLRVEERKGARRGVVGQGGCHGPRNRTSTMMPRRRRATTLRRERPMTRPLARQASTRSGPVASEEQQDIFTWNRSYTR